MEATVHTVCFLCILYYQLTATFTQPVCAYLLFTSAWLLCKVTGSDLASCCFVLQRNLVTNILASILLWLHIFEGLEGCKYAFLGGGWFSYSGK